MPVNILPRSHCSFQSVCWIMDCAVADSADQPIALARCNIVSNSVRCSADLGQDLVTPIIERGGGRVRREGKEDVTSSISRRFVLEFEYSLFHDAVFLTTTSTTSRCRHTAVHISGGNISSPPTSASSIISRIISLS